jgi:cephalosporin hydroxylase
MALFDLKFRATEKVRKIAGLPSQIIDLDTFELDPAEKTRLSAAASDGIGKLFFAHQGRIIIKWIHYLDIYQHHFAAYRNTPVKFLEIGVFKGGSLELWRNYFGMNAMIFGIDIEPACATYVTPPNQVRIGSQDDAHFLRSVVDEMGAPDIILDDGSHVARHQRASFETLFPLLKDGGLYVIEDLHTSYWPFPWEGGYRRKGTMIEQIKDMIDDMHGWYHRKPTPTPASDHIRAIHIYDSIVVIEKQKIERPSVTEVGQGL